MLKKTPTQVANAEVDPNQVYDIDPFLEILRTRYIQTPLCNKSGISCVIADPDNEKRYYMIILLVLVMYIKLINDKNINIRNVY